MSRTLRALISPDGKTRIDINAPVGAAQHVVSVVELCERITRAQAEQGIEGVSFSGDEPFEQAPALAEIACHARGLGLSVLSWSGFPRDHLSGPRAPLGAADLISQLDVLIDGPFVRRRIGQDPLRGSTNQTVHLLTARYPRAAFAAASLEVRIEAGRVVASGVVDSDELRTTLALLGL